MNKPIMIVALLCSLILLQLIVLASNTLNSTSGSTSLTSLASSTLTTTINYTSCSTPSAKWYCTGGSAPACGTASCTCASGAVRGCVMQSTSTLQSTLTSTVISTITTLTSLTTTVKPIIEGGNSTTTASVSTTTAPAQNNFYLAVGPPGCVSPGSGNYLAGTSVVLKAQQYCNGLPSTGYWTGSGPGSYSGSSGETATITINGNINEYAYYAWNSTVNKTTSTSTILPCTTGSCTNTTRSTTSLTTTTVNITILKFPTNMIYPGELPNITSTNVSKLSSGTIHNISASIGIPFGEIANSISIAINSNSVNFSCIDCSKKIDGFVAKTQLIKTDFIKRAIQSNSISSNDLKDLGLLVSQNATIRAQLVGNFTPSGFNANFNTSLTHKQNETAYEVSWVASGNTVNATINIEAFKKAQANATTLNSIPLSQRAVVPFINQTFNETNTVNETSTHELHIRDTIQGNTTTTKYVPTNVTTYKSEDGAVSSLTNVESGFENHIAIKKSNLPIKNITFSVNDNFTASAVSVKTFSANTTSIANRRIPKLPGKSLGLVSVNSTIKDKNINSVNYTFNVTESWLQKNHIDPRNIAMYRLNSSTGNWTRLPTVLIAANSTTYVYRARSPGMSFYAIAFTPVNITTVNSVITIVPVQVQYQVNGTTNGTSGPESPPLPFNTVLLVFIIIIVALAVIAYFYLNPPIKPSAPSTELPPANYDNPT